MNKERRAKINAVINAAYELKEEIECVKDEEEEAHDNLPESLQGSPMCEKMEEAIDAMDSACEFFGDAISYLESAME